MLNGWHKGERTGSGTIVWKAPRDARAGEIDCRIHRHLVARRRLRPAWCNTMGTATTMNSAAEALGMSLPGSAAIPRPTATAGQCLPTGRRIVDMVWEDLKPSDIMTREAFENAIVVNSAIGGSTNAPIHLRRHRQAHRRRAGLTTGSGIGFDDPAARQPAARRRISRRGLLPRRRRSGRRAELIKQGKIHEDALTVNGKTIGENCRGKEIEDRDVIRPSTQPLKRRRASSCSPATCSNSPS
jgi:dihydroxy-acid dehydratase